MRADTPISQGHIDLIKRICGDYFEPTSACFDEAYGRAEMIVVNKVHLARTLEPWIRTVTHRACTYIWRRESRRSLMRDVYSEHITSNLHGPAFVPADREVHAKAVAQALRSALEQLPSVYLDVLEKLLSGEQQNKIASDLDLSAPKVSRIKKHLKVFLLEALKLLVDDGSGDDDPPPKGGRRAAPKELTMSLKNPVQIERILEALTPERVCSLLEGPFFADDVENADVLDSCKARSNDGRLEIIHDDGDGNGEPWKVERHEIALEAIHLLSCALRPKTTEAMDPRLAQCKLIPDTCQLNDDAARPLSPTRAWTDVFIFSRDNDFTEGGWVPNSRSARNNNRKNTHGNFEPGHELSFEYEDGHKSNFVEVEWWDHACTSTSAPSSQETTDRRTTLHTYDWRGNTPDHRSGAHTEETCLFVLLRSYHGAPCSWVHIPATRDAPIKMPVVLQPAPKRAQHGRQRMLCSRSHDGKWLSSRRLSVPETNPITTGTALLTSGAHVRSHRAYLRQDGPDAAQGTQQ